MGVVTLTTYSERGLVPTPAGDLALNALSLDLDAGRGAGWPGRVRTPDAAGAATDQVGGHARRLIPGRPDNGNQDRDPAPDAGAEPGRPGAAADPVLDVALADLDGPLRDPGNGHALADLAAARGAYAQDLQLDSHDRNQGGAGLHPVAGATVQDVTAAVPEPSTWLLFLGGLLALGHALRSGRRTLRHKTKARGEESAVS